MGVSTNNTTPGARNDLSCAVYPKTGEFLLHGGWNGQYLADMWAFNFNNSRWTWISGSSVGSAVGSVGLKGEWSAAYYPAARYAAVNLVLIPESNMLYIFGGFNQRGPMNDLWGFKRDTLEWSWISGNSTANAVGVYGTMGYSSQNNYPGARQSHTMIYHDKLNLLILSGGYGYGFTMTSSYLADMWAFDVISNEWAWISGPSVSNWLGTNSTMGGIMESAVAIDVDTSNIYMFGGFGFNSLHTISAIETLWVAQVEIPQRFPTRNFSTSASLHSTSNIDTSSLIYTESPTGQLSLYVSSASETPSQFEDTVVQETIGPHIIIFSSSSRPRELRNPKTKAAQELTTIFDKFWSIKYRLLAAVLGALLVAINCFAFNLYRKRAIITASESSKEQSNSIPSFQQSESTISNMAGQTTMEISSIGIYLPGGMLLDGYLAYRKDKEIAKGGGGSVWLATAFDPSLKEYGETIIVKVPNANLMTGNAVAIFHQEIALMNAFKQSQNIATLLGYSEKPYATVFKYYRNGSLSTWINCGARTLRQSHAFMTDISTGVSLLHSKGVVHCDLKPDNVLIDSGWRLFAVLTDFGISRIVTNKLLNVGAYEVQMMKGASLAYAAPEVHNELRGFIGPQKSPSEIMARDVYAIGVIVNVLLNGKNAWR
eukprot:Partr_v1_DN27573_c2_g1_i3_m30147